MLTDADYVAGTTRWLERAVLGLDLCPFARAPHAQGRIRYAVSRARTPDELIEDLAVELRRLAAVDPADCETTLLIHPQVLGDFLDYNEFLGAADAVVEALDLDGVLQVASFHPRYQFADTAPDDIENATNRSPWPTLHLLREASVERVALAMADPDEIYRRNIATLRALGRAGWEALGTAAEE